MMGVIIAVVAVLEIHIDRNIVTSMKPSISLEEGAAGTKQHRQEARVARM